MEFLSLCTVRIAGTGKVCDKMNKSVSSVQGGPPFSKGDYVIHISGMVGIATGEIFYDPKNPVEKTKIILSDGFPMVDYCVKFHPATERERKMSYEDQEAYKTVRDHG